jgi:hypothetical protein
VKRRLKTIVPIVLVAAAVLYLGDLASLRFRIPNRETYGSVTVRQFYAVAQKDKSVEYMFQPPTQQECVNSLFPQLGDPPCWYLKRNTRQQITIDSGAPHFWSR